MRAAGAVRVHRALRGRRGLQLQPLRGHGVRGGSFICLLCPHGTLSSRRADRPQLTRDRFRYTSELARLYGVKDAAVTPYVSLGQGWQRAGTTRHDIRQSRNTFSMDFDYDTAYSALIGAQVNRKE